MRIPWIRIAVSLAVGFGLIWVVFGQVDLAQTREALASARPGRLAFGFLLLTAAYALRGARWLLWDRSASFAESVRAILVGFMGNNVLPARLGEVLRADWIARQSHMPHGRTSVLASIAVERIFDGLSIGVIALVGLAITPVGRVFAMPLLALGLAFGVLAVLIAVPRWWERTARAILARIHGRFPGHLSSFAQEKANYLIDGLVRLKGPAEILPALGLSYAIWITEVVSYWWIASAITPITIGVCLLLVAVTNFASLFPVTVGGIGVIEGAASAFLVSMGLELHDAVAIVVTQHTMQFTLTTIGGAYVFARYSGRRRDPVEAAVPAPPADFVASTREGLDLLRGQIALVAPDMSAPLPLTVVIPAYNEQRRLPKTVLETIRWCSTNLPAYEVLLVDDGSTDDTLSIAKLFEATDRNVRALSCAHMGKGAAVRAGMLNARGKYVLFMDADGATPLGEIPKLLDPLIAGHHVAIGSRVLQYPGEVKVETSLHRRIIGRTFAGLVNVFALGGIGDSQCGFKMFRADVVRPIFSQQKLNGFAFDVEILYAARRLGLSMVEVPVNWTNQPGSKVNLVTDSVRMLWDILQIRWRHRRSHGPSAKEFGLSQLPVPGETTIAPIATPRH